MKQQHLLWAATALAAGLVGLCGCTTTVNTVERADPAGRRQMVDDKRIITDASLNRKASIVGVNQGMTPGGLLKIQVELLNLRRALKRISYQFEWFDADGMQVNSPANAALTPLSLEGKESVFISSVAPSPLCKDFRLKLLEAK